MCKYSLIINGLGKVPFYVLLYAVLTNSCLSELPQDNFGGFVHAHESIRRFPLSSEYELTKKPEKRIEMALHLSEHSIPINYVFEQQVRSQEQEGESMGVLSYVDARFSEGRVSRHWVKLQIRKKKAWKDLWIAVRDFEDCPLECPCAPNAAPECSSNTPVLHSITCVVITDDVFIRVVVAPHDGEFLQIKMRQLKLFDRRLRLGVRVEDSDDGFGDIKGVGS